MSHLIDTKDTLSTKVNVNVNANVNDINNIIKDDNTIKRLNYRIVGAGATDRIPPLLNESLKCWCRQQQQQQQQGLIDDDDCDNNNNNNNNKEILDSKKFEWKDISLQEIEEEQKKQQKKDNNNNNNNINNNNNHHHQILDFVWESNYAEKVTKDLHDSAIVLNRLCNTNILDNKVHWAAVSQSIINKYGLNSGIVSSYLASNPKEVYQWCQKRYNNNNTDEKKRKEEQIIEEEEWWVLKTCTGSGGNGVWVFNNMNYEHIFNNQIPVDEETNTECVVQRYVKNPMLLREGRKFTFRVYGIIRGDMTAYLYRKSMLNFASVPYNVDNNNNNNNNNNDLFDKNDFRCKWDRIHLTNIQVNKKSDTFFGEIPCDLIHEFPEQYKQMKSIWNKVVEATYPFISVQRSHSHFELYGMDFLADDNGHVWCIEVNRTPATQTMACNFEEEEKFFNTLYSTILELCVIGPVIGNNSNRKKEEKEMEREREMEKKELIKTNVDVNVIHDDNNNNVGVVVDGWELVNPEHTYNVSYKSKGLFSNFLKFRMHLKKVIKQISVNN